MRRPFCVVPFVEAFSGYGTAFRNCCAADPQIASEPGQTFEQWQQDPRLEEFRQRMWTNDWLPECHRCQRQEQESGHSFRTAVNAAATDIQRNFGVWPNRWNLKFGNICNLACWTCHEQASSVIAQHKRRLNILPVDFEDPEMVFQRQWPDLQALVLKSYEFHDVVTLTLVGGEPLYNRTVAMFLQDLIDLGLATRTRLEFHTNATHTNTDLLSRGIWNHVCAFLSLDAVGTKAEWLRYGCRWGDIVDNIDFFQTQTDYVEVHCTLGVLNIGDLPALHKFCQSQKLPLKVSLLTDPDFMNLLYWSGDPVLIANKTALRDCGYEYYYNIIGTQARADSQQKLASYINQFKELRRDLHEFDSNLSQVLQVSAH